MNNSKNIVVLCDGTSNQASVYTETNVVRIARRLDKTVDSNGNRQVVFYDPGLGTENAPGALTFIGRGITKILGLAFGYGLSKNLADAYAFLMQNYEPGDRIYIFGFSRGAYTARALTALLGRVGLLDRGCNSLIPYAIKYFRKKNNDHQLNFFKKRFSRTYALTWSEVIPGTEKKGISRGVIPVHFLGVWDTVKSVGLFRNQVVLPDTDWLPNMINGRHAVAYDEKRRQYQPELWYADTDNEVKHQAQKDLRKRYLQSCLHENVKTKWFSGAHADVGGGYGLSAKLQKEIDKIRKKIQIIDWDKKPKADNRLKEKLNKEKENFEERISDILKIEEKETALAYEPLKWMTEAAAEHGLLFEKEKIEKDADKEIQEGIKPHKSLYPYWWILGEHIRDPEGPSKKDVAG
jgi:uncharacterized protein (DUF2235 family)